MAVERPFELPVKPDRARLISILLAAVGLLDSLYLTALKLANATAVCAGVGDCEAVNNSRYSELAGFPVALLGAGAYLAILLLLLSEPNLGMNTEYARLGVFGIALSGTLYSAYLTYVEVAILQAICPFCVLSAALMIAICAIGVSRLSRQAKSRWD